MKQSYTNFDDLLSDVADGVEQIMQDVAPQIESVLQTSARRNILYCTENIILVSHRLFGTNMVEQIFYLMSVRTRLLVELCLRTGLKMVFGWI